jgi:biofilm PGA synthesis N-glycosyltransferase PgaC
MTGPPRTDDLPAYAVVTPVRDEEEHLADTADALVAQTHRPQRWVIVDDGSRDSTRTIADRYAGEHAWIEAVSLPTGARRARGAPIVRAFAAGMERLGTPPEVVVKLDGDITVEPDYFARVAEAFAEDPRAGVVGGVAYVQRDGQWRRDGSLRHVNGVAKAYRTACLQDFGGLPETMGWDGIDEYLARVRGWNVRVLTDTPIHHHRARGSKQPWYRARWEEGVGSHYIGYLWRWLAVRAAYRMFAERPPVLGGLVLAAGFSYARLRRLPQVPDAGARAEVAAEQRRLLRGLLWRRRGSGGELPENPV